MTHVVIRRRPDASGPGADVSAPEKEDRSPINLAEGIFVCVTQGHAIFANFNRDLYSGDPLELHGAPLTNDATPAQNLDALLAYLTARRDEAIEYGLLTADPAAGRAVALTPPLPIEGNIFGLDDQRAFGLTGEAAVGLRITLPEMWDFFAAASQASLRLRFNRIAAIVQSVRRRKARARNPDVDLDRLRRLAAVFRRLRPWYPRKYLCRFDSLALVDFLAKQNVYPTWVFAAQAQPFGAHCWVQHEGLLLNEGTEYAGQFTPIMLV